MQSRTAASSKGNRGLSVKNQSSSYGRVRTKQSEYWQVISGRLAIQKSQRFERLKIEPKDIFLDCGNQRNTPNRPTCFPTEPPVTKIHVLASGPRQLYSRFPSALLEKPFQLRIPSIFLNRKGTCLSKVGPFSSSYHNICMVNSALLAMSVQYPTILPNLTTFLQGPQGQKYTLQEGNQLQLVAWKVSGKLWKVREYQNSLPHLSQIPEGQGQYLITNRPGEIGLAVVVNGKLIPL